MRHTCSNCNGVRPETCAYNGEAYGVKIALLRKFGLHASADALAARATCRTCTHLTSDARNEPCATCRDFGKWEEARSPGVPVRVGEHNGGDYDMSHRTAGVAPSHVPKGWKITKRDGLFKPITIMAPNGYSAYVTNTAPNPENVLYMLAEALLADGVGTVPSPFPDIAEPATVERLMELVRTLPPRSMRAERDAYLTEIERIAHGVAPSDGGQR